MSEALARNFESEIVDKNFEKLKQKTLHQVFDKLEYTVDALNFEKNKNFVDEWWGKKYNTKFDSYFTDAYERYEGDLDNETEMENLAQAIADGFIAIIGKKKN